ncbi:hypothetical protein BN1050_00831 [Metalysinibacillus saudimassiliensis]|uniref:Uncharacterized protein n=1 Tax=Metalysinibacillus saudimassiliensis TaxID=1461583 RepID=A0A078M4K5_9BACL|nr:hypothetical protein BN1050_00831 [Metalysinibacillus saudimassiliensis]
MLLPIDEQLHKQYKMMDPPSLERAMAKIAKHDTPADVRAIMGRTLLPQQFLIEEEETANAIFSEARKYWGRIPESLHARFLAQHIQIEKLHAQLDNFFYSQQGKEQFLTYLRQHNAMTLPQLLQLLIQRTIDIGDDIALKQIYLYPIDARYMVHFIYQQDELFWYELFCKKVYSLCIHEPIDLVPKLLQLAKHFEQAVKISYAHVDNLNVHYEQRMQQLILFVTNYNPPSASLKQLDLYYIFLLARRKKYNGEHIIYKIKEIRAWDQGDHVLTKTEKVALRYVLFTVHALREEYGKVISNAHYLLNDECLNNYAIKIMLNYEDVLPAFPANEQTLIKNYHQNYMEQLYYYYLEALVALKKYKEALHIIKSDPLASCMIVQDIVTNQTDNEALDARMQAIKNQTLDEATKHQTLHFLTQLIAIFEATTYKGLARRLKVAYEKIKEAPLN